MSIPRLCQRGHDLNDPAVGVVRTDGRVRCRVCRRLNYKPHPRPSTLDRLLAKVDVDAVSGCWVWSARLDPNGYGHLRVGGRDGRYLLAHRVSYELHVGPISEGLQLDHTCHDPETCVAPCQHRRCVNPEHLEPVTPQVNNGRSGSPSALNAVKTHCPAGHPLSGANLYVCPRGTRKCRACRAEATRRYLRKKRAA